MKPYEQLLQENNDLQDRLNVAEDTLRAIRMGEVDALTVCTAQGDPVYTLQNADQPYRSLVEQMQQGAVTISDDGSVLYCNRYFATLVGHSPEFIVSQNISQFIVAEEQAQFTAFIQTAHANEGVYQEFHCQNCQSQAIAVYIVANVLQLGPRVVICLIVTDLSESKHFQQLLRQSEDRYRTVINAMPDGLVLFSSDGTIQSCNPAAERIVGLTVDQMRGLTPIDPRWDAINEDGSPCPGEMHPSSITLKTGKAVSNAVIGTHRPDGNIFWSLVNSTPIFGADGQSLTAVVVSFADITERKQAEEKLHRYSQRLESTNRLARAMTSDLDLNRFYDSFVNELRSLMPIDRTGIIMLNKTADQWQVIRQWTNYQPVFVLGEWHPVRGSVIEQIVASASPFLEDELDEDELWPESAILRREGIRSRYLQPLIIHGQVVGLLSVSSRQPAAFSADDRAIVNSIADQLTNALFSARLYDEVQRYASELEQRVGERTAQLEAANKELEAFSYSVSHDLRAPLRTVDGFSRILLRDYAAQLPETAQQQLQRVRDGAQQLGKLIDDLLAFSRTGRHAINKQNVSVRDIVHSVLNELKSEHENRQVEITVGELPTLEADPVLLKQVFFNLIANALKFTGRCAVARIEIGCTQIDGAKVIYVKDNGAGFDMAYADKLFGVFQRLHSTEEFPGTGVGLAIVQRIIHRHGGRIWAMAEVDKGATFYLTLKEGAPHE